MSDYEWFEWPDECEECAYEGGGCAHDMRPPVHGPRLPPVDGPLTVLERQFLRVYSRSLEKLIPPEI